MPGQTRLRAALVALGLFFCVSGSARSRPAGHAVVEGDVFAIGTHSRIPGAVVTLDSMAARYVTTSDDRGHYRFSDLPAGTEYTLTAEHDGFLPAIHPPIRVAKGHSRMLDVELFAAGQ